MNRSRFVYPFTQRRRLGVLHLLVTQLLLRCAWCTGPCASPCVFLPMPRSVPAGSPAQPGVPEESGPRVFITFENLPSRSHRGPAFHIPSSAHGLQCLHMFANTCNFLFYSLLALPVGVRWHRTVVSGYSHYLRVFR